jgi:hypothetical protein
MGGKQAAPQARHMRGDRKGRAEFIAAALVTHACVANIG